MSRLQTDAAEDAAAGPPTTHPAPEPTLARTPRAEVGTDSDRVLLVAHPHAADVLPPSIASTVAEGSIDRTSSITAAFKAATLGAQRPRLVVVHLSGVDRFSDGWAGHRLIERLTRAGGVDIVAWTSADDLDAQALAKRLGARIAKGSPRQGLRRGDEPLSAWFRRRHHARWNEWLVEACAALASAADRTAQAEYCRDAWALKSAATAHRRLRYLRGLLGEETRDHPGRERRLAMEILRAVSTSRPITLEPLTIRSVHIAARALRAHPELAASVGLSPTEAADVLAIADTELAIGAAVNNTSGRPPAQTWSLRRDQAIGRIASGRTPNRARAEVERQRITAHVERTLLTIHDALDDGAG